MDVKSFATGFILAGVIAGAAWHYQPKPPPQTEMDIVLPMKTVTFVGDKLMSFVGTLSGPHVGYPNNTMRAFCSRDELRCDIGTIEVIGAHQMGSIGLSAYDITRWDDKVIVAKSGGAAAGDCAAVTINVFRATKEIDWIQEPVNQSEPQCSKSDTATYKWTIETSPALKALDDGIKNEK